MIIFFDDLKTSYRDFGAWFKKKKDEEVYVCYDNKNQDKILGFLYLKKEDENEDYSMINPTFKPKKRLKIGTFKTISTGFRLGERFLKMIFDNASNFNVDEIYVTMFEDKNNNAVLKLINFFQKWGFEKYGFKTTNSGKEIVLVKNFKEYCPNKSVYCNFPITNPKSNSYIIPISPQFHTNLIPDAHTKKEAKEAIENLDKPHCNALEKVYITFADLGNIKSGDWLLIYRSNKGNVGNANYKSMITSIAIFSEKIVNFKSEAEFLNACENRSVYSKKELLDSWYRSKWHSSKYKVKIIKFLYLKNLAKPILLNDLRDMKLLKWNEGVMSLKEISNDYFLKILKLSQTKI